MRNKLKLYQALIDDIVEQFQCGPNYGPPELALDYYWQLNEQGREVRFQNEPFSSEDDQVNYALSIYGTAIFPTDEFTMVAVRSDSHYGIYTIIFDNKLKVE